MREKVLYRNFLKKKLIDLSLYLVNRDDIDYEKLMLYFFYIIFIDKKLVVVKVLLYL